MDQLQIQTTWEVILSKVVQHCMANPGSLLISERKSVSLRPGVLETETHAPRPGWRTHNADACTEFFERKLVARLHRISFIHWSY